MKLAEQARRAKASFLAKTDDDTVELVTAGLAAIAASHPAGRALARGDRAPDFERHDVRGGSVRLAERLARGPVVLDFYRGGWCPFCSLELTAWAERIDALRAAGADLIAISPAAADHALADDAPRDPPFAVLTDGDQGVATAYGLVLDLPEPARAAQRRLGAPLDRLNADGTWRLPVPATYLVDADGVIRWAQVADDYTERAEPDAVIAAADRLRPA